jgi:AraC-like DNA-binding protein
METGGSLCRRCAPGWRVTRRRSRAGSARCGTPQIGRTVSLIHREPGRPWTLASFADQIPMSRSAFAARFTELVGEPAMSYATRWRMHLAAAMRLCGEGATVAALAERFGYRPRPRPPAFKRVLERPPGNSSH